MSPELTKQTRRSFLTQTASGALTFQIMPRLLFAANSPKVNKVHVIFKTHLDIGFTDLAENVLSKYLDLFIPAATTLARETREQHGEKQFKWTTGSWLIHTFLEKADNTNRKKMEQAIEVGDICWHALPFTMHSEALYPSVFEAGLQLSRRLDERFGKTTISGKMTDVPGHTRGIVPILQRNDISLLHIGVNPASMPPDVPSVFVWQTPDDSRIAVMYQKEYGGIMQIPYTSEAVALMFTGDNHGPQTVEQVMDAYKHIQEQFPEAEVVASDLNAVAQTVAGITDKLPVITKELGDSWIHGIGSDPLKMAQLRALSRKRNEWIQSDNLEKYSDADLAFCLPLCMVGEHTWGLDVKTHLQAWDIYTPDALADARKTEPFKRIEASWREKRQYIQDAVQSLPEPLTQQATTTLHQLTPVMPDFSQYQPLQEHGSSIETNTLLCSIDPITGALIKLQNKHTGREWASPQNPIGMFSYQTFSQADYDRFMSQYLTGRPDWALKDFGKPGLEAFNPKSSSWSSKINAAWHREEDKWHTLIVEKQLAPNGKHLIPGMPQHVVIAYRIHKQEPQVDITLKWFGKKANRLPEALWFSFTPVTEESGSWFLDKMGQDISSQNVVRNGGHKLHAITQSIRYTDQSDTMKIYSLDAPLVAPGERTLLNFDNANPAPGDGMHFCLYNNVWGTNFVMWFDEDMLYRFSVAC